MPIEFRRAYTDEIRDRYKNAKRKQKSAILDEFCQVCGYRSRKHAIQILNGKAKGPDARKRPGPASRYIDALSDLKALWRLMSYICSKKMKAAMPLWLPFYRTSDRRKALLLQMSPSTIDRLLKLHRRSLGKGLSTTRPSIKMKTKIPLKLLDGETKVPGFVEGDTVAHCGNSIAGEYANTLTVVDLFSGWTELRSCWTKDATGITSAVKKIESRVPFTLVGFASDNGSEFINDVLYSYFSKRPAPINFVRRRAYKKNDNAHVEQKNWTHVRELFGYERFDDPSLVPLMNEIYQAYWCPLQNYFTPSMKLVAKERIGGSIKKHYDEPKTPAQRLLDCSLVPEADKVRIGSEVHSRNPIDLKQRLDQKLKEFFERVDELKRSQRPKTGS